MPKVRLSFGLTNRHFSDGQSGLRLERYRAPTPDGCPGAQTISTLQAKALIEGGAIAIDVSATEHSRYDELDGTWLIDEPRMTLPGAIWLPEVGRGRLDEAMQHYLSHNLEQLSGGDLKQPMIIFCIADCWMSWNAVQRIAALGYQNVHWFPLGTDGWLDQGFKLKPVTPVPVEIE